MTSTRLDQHAATHCNTLQHTTTHCITLQHTTTHYNSLHHTASHCNTLQHTATQYNTRLRRDDVDINSMTSTLSFPSTRLIDNVPIFIFPLFRLQTIFQTMIRKLMTSIGWYVDYFDMDTATHCNTLQHTATHCNTLQHTTTHCNTRQLTATHHNTLQHTATHCNTRHWPDDKWTIAT